MNRNAAWCMWTGMLWCASWLLVACSGPEQDVTAATGSDGRRIAGSDVSQAVQASQAKDYPNCEAVRRDAGVFLQDRHSLDRPAEPDWPGNSISCSWSFSDDARCHAIGFVAGKGEDYCVSDGVYITVNRSVAGLDNVEQAVARFARPGPGATPWVPIRDPRLQQPAYANIVVFKRENNYSISWEFRMVVTGNSNIEPVPTEVVVRHSLRHPGGDQPHEQLRALSPPPPTDAVVVGGYLEMLEAFEATHAWSW